MITISEAFKLLNEEYTSWEDVAHILDIDDYLDDLDDNDAAETKKQIEDLERQAGIEVVGILRSDNKELDYRFLGDDDNAYLGSIDNATGKWVWHYLRIADLD